VGHQQVQQANAQAAETAILRTQFAALQMSGATSAERLDQSLQDLRTSQPGRCADDGRGGACFGSARRACRLV
jgi:hypothetical protein